MGRACDQLPERGQLFLLHQVTLQPLLVLVSGARFPEKLHERLILNVLPQESESSQHQHRCKDCEDAKHARRHRGCICEECPESQDRQREDGQHRHLREDGSPSAIGPRGVSLQVPLTRGESGGQHPDNGSGQRHVVKAAGVIGAREDGLVEHLRSGGVQGAGGKKVQV